MSILKTSELVIHDGSKTLCKVPTATLTPGVGDNIFTDDNGDLPDLVIQTEPDHITLLLQAVRYKKTKVKASITWNNGWGTLGVLAIHMEKLN